MVRFFADSGVGIIQLPCPKFVSGVDIRSKKKCTDTYRNYCKHISEKLVKEIERYYSKKYEILGIIGVEFSTNCGVYKFSDGKKGWGKGIFFEELEKQLYIKNIQIPFFGFDTNNAIRTLKNFKILLENS